MNKTNIFLGGGNLAIETSKMVETKEILELYVEGEGAIQLEVKIEADFNRIPEQYHEIFLNIFTSKYLNKVSFGDNPFSQCRFIPKRKWYEFWKK